MIFLAAVLFICRGEAGVRGANAAGSYQTNSIEGWTVLVNELLSTQARNLKRSNHPAAGWLRDRGRDPAMVKGIEITNVRNFEAETR